MPDPKASRARASSSHRAAPGKRRLEMIRHLPLVSPRPDARQFIDHLMGRSNGGRTPLVEYLVDAAVMKPILTGLLGRPWVEYGNDRISQKACLDNVLAFWHRLGYDFVRFEQGLPFFEGRIEGDDRTADAGRRAWADEHKGAIANWTDFERYPWPRIEDFDFFPFEYRLYRQAAFRARYGPGCGRL